MVLCTIKMLVIFGSTCSTHICKLFLPQTLAAIIKSSAKIDKAAARVILANTGILNIPMAIMAFEIDGPNIAVINIAIIRAGNAKIKSFPRIIISSKIVPALIAARRLRGTPRSIPVNVAVNATKSEVLAPSIIIERTSRPK